MKKLVLITIVLSLISLSFLEAQTTAIPDASFEDYLETHAQDGIEVVIGDVTSMGDGIANNGLVLTDRISDALLLDVSGLNISNLTGIEDFTALENLFCSDNNLEDLDITNNTNLSSLLCGANSLTTLSVSNNINLETLNFANNQIQSIDVSNNLTLERLTASGNQLSTIDVSNNSELTLLSVSNNRILGELVVSNNTNLENLFCASNQISTLNLSANTLIKNLDASDNALISLDLSTINSVLCPDPQTDPITLCQGSATINVSRNQLSALIVANGFNDLVSVFNASDNPELFCIQIDNGFTPTGWIKDDWAYYSENPCIDIYTYVPDDNFEQALINQGYDDTLDNLVLTANINAITSLIISNASIFDLTGIEDFIALEVLDCSTNTIETIDLSNNTMLLQLDVSNNDLTFLDLTANLALTTFNCSSNLISDLNINTLVDLYSLNCSNNSLTNLDMSSNILLNELDCSFNQLESLDVTSNTALVGFFCNDNNLFALNFNNGNNTLVTTFNVTNNSNLFCIQVDDVAFSDSAAGWQKDASASYSLGCGTYIPDDNFEQALIDQGIDSDNTLNNFVATADINTITTLDVSNLMIANLTGIEDFLALEELNCSNNELLGLNLSNNKALEILDCSINLIEDLDLAVNTALTSLLCNYNVLKTLNVENGNNAALNVFNTTENPNLFCINVDDAIVASIPASWQKDAIASYDGDCANNRFTAIPDAFFEQALIDLGFDDVIDSQVLTAHIEHVLTLNVSDGSISDLTGIQDFKSLVELDCSGNFLDTLDVSGMIYLERLNCSSNYLLTNDVNDANGLLNTTGTINLIELYCASNNLNDLDISQNSNLELLDCADNNISQLNLNDITSLRTLNCSNNNLTSLNISNNNVLEDVNCNNNQLTDLTTIGTNNNTLTDLSCANNSLSNLEITNYQALTTLSCGSNELTQLNVTNNTALNFISASNNQISDINLLSNINLVEVSVAQNDLTELDVSLNTLLERLNCDFNEITGLDISANISLEVLSCSNNQITDLDVSANVNLIDLNASSNVLTGLSLSNSLGALKSFNIGNNQIEGDLDLTTIAISACIFQSNQSEYCPETISINVSNNLLSFINIQNGINTEIANFNAANNPNLTCIQVDDAANVNPSWIKDETTEYNIDCNFGETFVPDDNFEQALIDLGYDSGPLNDYVLTENIVMLTSLDVSGNGIMDFTGIQDFEALEELNFSNNALGELNLSSNINLISVDCSNNNLTLLDVTDITSLKVLNCSNNGLNVIDLSTNINLLELNIANNIFTSFLASDILSLQVFNCDNNQIIELDFQQNQFLTSLSCQNNLLETLNIRNGQNPILTSLSAINNPDLLCVETDNGTVPSGAVWTIDATAQFAINCFFGETYVPDDNFEQALIDLGYDTGPLDDYVFTEMIEDVTFLNVSGREIEDLTGIEDFIDLTNLNVENNSVSMIDLSNNISLLDLDASGNQLTDIDISLLINLLDIDVSSNSISQIDFDTNLSLTDINVSINLLENINVDGLMSLEKLNCASNLITSLNVTQNPNLNLLFCQSNLLIADQLNLQNGNNENLELFNATNNSDLACILVDDPVAVISNTDGIYDNWFKDVSSSYKTVCSDADNDGVPNEDDLCPTTEFGATVDLFGCAIPNLPNDNYAISITGETCLNSNNGKITIAAQELYSYNVVLEREDFYEEYNFTNDIDIFNLLAGTYQMCITIEEWPNYESCYTIVITQPDPLEVFASRAPSGNAVSLDMSGSVSYNIEFNGDLFTTHNSNLSLQLQYGTNHLKVSTDIECQGVFEKEIFVSGDFIMYPNPFSETINILNGTLNGKVTVNIYSTYGQLIASKSYINGDVEMSLNTNDLGAGIYIVTAQSEYTTSTYKMVKK